MVENIELVNYSLSLSCFVVFCITLLYKWKFFDFWLSIVIVKVNLLIKTKYQDICYFCFCFWISLLLGLIVGCSIADIVIATILSRYFLKQTIEI